MRQYDDPVEVRRGEAEDPDQFLWRGRLWKVRTVVAHRVETAPWRQSAPDVAADLLVERELWRVEAGRGMLAVTGPDGDLAHTSGVFDLSFNGSDGRWQLVGCAD